MARLHHRCRCQRCAEFMAQTNPWKCGEDSELCVGISFDSITEVSGKSNIRSVNRCSIYWLQRALMCLWVWSYFKKIGIRSEDCGFWTGRAAVCHSGWFVASVIVWPSLTCRTTRDSCTVGRWAWFLTTRSYEPLDFTQNALEQLKHPGHQSLFQTDIKLLPPTDPVMLTLRADFTFRLCKCDFKLWNFSG